MMLSSSDFLSWLCFPVQTDVRTIDLSAGICDRNLNEAIGIEIEIVSEVICLLCLIVTTLIFVSAEHGNVCEHV